MSATRYGRTATITVHEQRCLWRGVFGARPVRAILITEPGHKPLALVTTDMHNPVVAIIERYAGRWSIEVAFHEAKNTTGVGEAATAPPTRSNAPSPSVSSSRAS